MRIFLLLDPPTTTAQETQISIIRNKPVFYKPDKVQKAKNTLMRYLRTFKPDKPMEGPIKLEVIWRLPKGKSHKHNEWRVTRPDTDNLDKMLKDCMTQVGYWKDDSQVVVEHIEKIWSDEPVGISICYEPLEKFKKEELNDES